MNQNASLALDEETLPSYSTKIPRTEQTSPFASLPARRKRYGFLWGLGGSILSVIGFVVMILFEQYNGILAELRNDLKQFHQTSADYVKKDSLQRFKEHMKECQKELQASNVARAQLEQELRASEKTRGEMASELQKMRERLSYLEGRQSKLPLGQGVSDGAMK